MSAFLKKLFKPKWKSSNAMTRKEYISALNPSLEEDNTILLDLARNDTDNQVRRAAINRIDSVNTLLSLYKEPSELIKPAVKDRLEGLAKTNSLPIYELITDEALLTELIVNSDNPDQYLAALVKLSTSSLETIAINAKLNQLRLSAVELVVDEAPLTTIEKQAKSRDKKVYQLAKSKLKEIKESKKQRAATIEKQTAIVKSLEIHANSETAKLYGAKLTSLLDAWRALNASSDDHLSQEFETHKQACVKKAEQFKQEQEQADLAQQQKQQQLDERKQTLSTLDQTIERFQQAPLESGNDLPALDAIIKTQEIRWLEATQGCTVDSAEQRHYQQQMGALKSFLKSAQLLISKKDEFSAILSSSSLTETSEKNEDIQKTKAFLNDIDWPKHFPTPPLLIALSKAVGSIREKQKQSTQDTVKLQQHIDEQLTLLDQELTKRELKASTQRFKEINKRLQSADKSISSKYAGKLQLLSNQLDELRDWHGFAVTPKQTELCELVERLAEQHLEPKDKADKIKKLQDEWKQLGGSSDQKIWLRFKAGCDAAYAPCREFFEEQKTLKKNNVEKRKTILQQVSDFVDQNDWGNTDWKAVEKINRAARDEWKACYPVDFKANKDIQKSFNELLAKLDQYLDDERTRNKQLKQDIVEKAQALINHEPLSEAIEGAKGLQSEWQLIGITLHKDDRNLWKEYRAACDQIFSRRDAENESKQQEINDAISQAEALCEEANQLSASITSESQKDISELRNRFKSLPSLPHKERERVKNKFDAIISTLEAEQAKQTSKRESQHWLNANKTSKLIRNAAEQLVNGESLESINALGDDISSLDLPQPLNNALNSAWQSVTQGDKATLSYCDTEDAIKCCIQCEIASEIESPQEDQSIRMALQVNRLSQGMNSQQSSNSKQDELDKYLLDWFTLYLIPSEVRKSLENRIDNVLTKRFS